MSAPLAAPFYLSPRWWRQTSSAGIAYLVATALALLTSIVAARALGPLNFGTVVLATTVVAALTTFLDFSLEEAVVHHGARALATDDVGALRALLLTSLRMDAIVGIAVFVVVVVTAGPVASFVSGGELAPLFLRIAALESFAATLNGTTGAALMLAGRPELRAWSTVGGNVARLIAVVVAIRVFHGGAEGVLWGYVAGAAIGALAQGAAAANVARGRWAGTATTVPPASMRRLATFGLHSSTATSVVAIRGGIVSASLGRIAGSSAVGLLSVAMFPVTLAAVVTAPLRLTTFAEQSRMAAEGRSAELWRLLRGYSLAAVGVGIIAAAAGWVLLPVLLPALYSDAFEGAVGPARVLLAAAVATLVTAWAKALPAAMGRPGVRTAMATTEIVLLGALMLAFGKRDATAAAVAISVVSVAVAVGWVVVARRMLTTAGSRPAAGRGREEEPR